MNQATKNVLEYKSVVKNTFIYESIKKHLGKEDLSLNEAQDFVSNNKDNVKFSVEFDTKESTKEKWTLRVFDKTYKANFNLKEANEKEGE